MWPGAEDRRAEPRPEAGQHGGGPRRGSNASRLAAAAGAVTRERPNLASQGRSSVSEVGGRLGTMARAGMERWRDRLALVTGASGGIGAAVARALVQQGLKVVGCARTVGNIEELAAECKSAGYPGTLIPYRCDLSNEEDILSMFSAVRSQHSGVDICINNAGLARPDSLLSGSTSGWKDMFNGSKWVHAHIFSALLSFVLRVWFFKSRLILPYWKKDWYGRELLFTECPCVSAMCGMLENMVLKDEKEQRKEIISLPSPAIKQGIIKQVTVSELPSCHI
ncbi:dehydrogenase/reductase SDR family member 11 isoform X2 [Heterocephalus glaber]|uniref:Dehydrogenase/reductase SDR family member 11 isoform X2 n=1 Tax=Heterocephalus glaber TaxID=10181 RepID=A0AAX6S8M2_HETGA|nr:dehydrogenase/reductase SDR family member 11 isoform X2 [Heterocephalus glaber]